MTYPPVQAQTARPPQQSRRHLFWLLGGIAGTLATIAGIAGVALVLSHSSNRDAHAQAACSALERAEGENLLDGAITQIKAVQEARKSSDSDLRAAANKTSAASQFPTDSPLYQNPGDVQANAVAAWCKDNH